MFDFITYYSFWADDCHISSDMIITLEDYIDDIEMLEETLLEKLKEYFEIEDIELIDYTSLVDREVNVENIE
jgi:hypothetical protein